MSDPVSNANAYLQTRVMSASPEELRLMLLDGALRFANQGLEGLRKKDYEASFTGISQCRNIILELMTSVRDEVAPDLCDKVRAVYTFIFAELTEASLSKDADRLSRTIELIEYERETWALLMQQIEGEKASGKAPSTTEARPAPSRAPSELPAAQPHEGGSFNISA